MKVWVFDGSGLGKIEPKLKTIRQDGLHTTTDDTYSEIDQWYWLKRKLAKSLKFYFYLNETFSMLLSDCFHQRSNKDANCLKNSWEKRLKMLLNSGMVRNATFVLEGNLFSEEFRRCQDVKRSLIKKAFTITECMGWVSWFGLPGWPLASVVYKLTNQKHSEELVLYSVNLRRTHEEFPTPILSNRKWHKHYKNYSSHRRHQDTSCCLATSFWYFLSRLKLLIFSVIRNSLNL